jgi:hypothetical protein
MKKWKSAPYLLFFMVSILLTTIPAPAQEMIDFGVGSTVSLPVLAPHLSTDGLTLHNGVPPLVIFADLNPAMQGLRASGPTAAQALALPAAATSSFVLTFLDSGQHDPWGQSCGAFPEEAKTAFQAAAAIWANTVRSAVPITVTACWANLNSPSLLGYSGGELSFRDFSGSPRPFTWFSKSLANALAGTELDPTSQDMYITYNSGFTWYYGTDGIPPVGLYDLVTVAAHEIGHGLNFYGTADYSDGMGSYGFATGFPNIYDAFMESGDGTPLISYPNPSTALGTLLTSGDLWFDGVNADAANGGVPVKIYAPSTWMGGSSYSHLDYSTFAGTPNSLMVYAIGSGSANHSTGTVAPGMLKDMGWGLASDSFTLGGIVQAWDMNGPPLEGALVTIAGKTATTDSVGNFSIPAIPAGTYTLTISKDGYNTYTNPAFVLNFNQRSLFLLTGPPLSISGKVLIGSPTGPALEGASVSLAGQTALTDSTGAFSIKGLQGGTYALSVSRQGYNFSVNTRFHLYSDQNGLVFFLIPIQTAFSISGTVLSGSASGPALAGAMVAIAGKTATTSSNGSFSITGIAAGTYTLSISRGGYLTATTNDYTIANDQNGLVFFLTPVKPALYTISGTVRQGSATGAALEGATVSIAGKTAVTDCKGNFKIEKIPASSYTLTVSRKGYLTKTTTGYVIAGDQCRLVFFLLLVKPCYFTMSGTVVRGRAGGPALDDATVAIAGKSDKTDRRGNFKIEHIPAGSYTLTISKPGYVTRVITGYAVNRNWEELVFPLKSR